MSISIKNLQKAFGAKQVLNGIDYELEDGGVYCLMGPSGMGKTTLLRILMDLENADGGNVQGLGWNDIAVMFQENRLLEWMDAVDNVAVMRRGIRDKKLKKEIEENLQLILPADCLHQPVAQLSGGMKRRVALARAMNYPSKLIILDEPFTGLDRETKLEVIDYILKMRGDRILLVATHGVEDAAMLGAKVIHLEELLGVSAQEENEDDEDNILLTREEVMRNMNIFYGIPTERYPEIIQKLGGYEEAVAFGEQKGWVEIRTTKAAKILYLSVDGLMRDMRDGGFTLMKTNLVREMSNKLAILNLKNQILAEPRLRKRILIYLNILPSDKAGWKDVPFGQKELAQYLNAISDESFAALKVSMARHGMAVWPQRDLV